MRQSNRARQRALAFAAVTSVVAGGACSAPGLGLLPDLPPGTAEAGGTGGGPGGAPASGGTGAMRFDASPVVTAAHPPPPVSGGTLLALQAGGKAVIADTDRDRIVVVDVDGAIVLSEVALGAGAEPGRLVEDGAGRVHVALRGSGDVVSIDVASGGVLARRHVCKAPRGIAWDKSSDQLLVACLEGSLVELPAAGGAVTRTTSVAPDLRDVAFLGGSLVVTRFRSAEVLFLDGNRSVVSTTTLPGDGAGFEASVAWRAIAATNGMLAIAHQRSFHGRIAVSGGGSGGTGSSDSGGTGAAASAGVAGTAGVSGMVGAAGAGDEIDLPSQNGYGSPFVPCSSVVEGTLSFVTASGTVYTGANLDGGVLPVDVATTSSRVAVAFAGALSGGISVGVYETGYVSAGPPTNCASSDIAVVAPDPVAVAFDTRSGKLLVQSRAPAELSIYDVENPFQAPTLLDLGGESSFDTGHDLFHTDGGGGIACASCHPEGTEDGRVWNFSDVGARRTQPLDVGLAGTAPFHWNGELADFGALMDRIFVARMSGPMESDDRAAALEEYVYALPRRPAVRDASDPAAQRGKLLFESNTTGCTTCHSGPNFSNGNFGDIGKGTPLQIPSLIAVSARAPYMHDGCAATLLGRFDPNCGGSTHGDVSSLSSAELGDLVAYLETL